MHGNGRGASGIAKERLDLILTGRGLFESREKARSAIMAGSVYVCGNRADKPGMAYDEDCEITVRTNPNPYVSRGGLKLAKALDVFGICLDGAVAADIGASTGGFTDCMLGRGAVKIYSIDVGYGQLAWKLRNDPRVVSMERTNARYLKKGDTDLPCDFAALDVSFISLTKVLPAVREIMKEQFQMAALIKPQFEAGREKVGRRGVVRDIKTHIDVIINMAGFIDSIGMKPLGLTYSPVRGPEGNIEYLMHIGSDDPVRPRENPVIERLAAETAEQAHAEL